MGLLKGLILATMDTVMLPVKVAQDIVTLGRVDQPDRDSFTVEQLKKIREDVADSE